MNTTSPLDQPIHLWSVGMDPGLDVLPQWYQQPSGRTPVFKPSSYFTTPVAWITSPPRFVYTNSRLIQITRFINEQSNFHFSLKKDMKYDMIQRVEHFSGYLCRCFCEGAQERLRKMAAANSIPKLVEAIKE